MFFWIANRVCFSFGWWVKWAIYYFSELLTAFSARHALLVSHFLLLV